MMTKEQWASLYEAMQPLLAKVASRIDIQELKVKLYRVNEIIRIDISTKEP